MAAQPAVADGGATQAFPTLPYAIAGAGCTQEDIPAIEIFLTARPWDKVDPPPRPHLRIEVAGVGPGTSSTLTLSPLHRDPTQRSLARAALQREEGDAVWLTGTLRLDRVDPGKAVEGTYRFCEDKDRCAESQFKANWKPGTARCG